MRFLKVFAANLAGWAVFSLLDWFTESDFSFYTPIGEYVFLAGVLFSIIYMIIHIRKNKGQRGSAKEVLKDTGLWLGASVLLGVVIVTLVINNVWIVHQATGGWENFLNGIEYFLFGMLWAGEPLLLIWLYYGIRALIFYRMNESSKDIVKDNSRAKSKDTVKDNGKENSRGNSRSNSRDNEKI
ncbi:MAG: hypothetical protein MJ131_11560 [Lachnospiraceae bacterium]|nr:hypothetical protein [Lachnospiraceae bacterium]